MKLWIKRGLAVALIAGAVILLFQHLRQLLDWPHLYPDLRMAGVKNLVFLALTLLAVALAWISASYMLLNCEKKILHFLIPAAVFALLIFAARFSLTRVVGEIPCSFTDSLASCREEFDDESFRVEGRPLYPLFPSGELTSYARFEKGEVLADSIVRTYEPEQFVVEAARVRTLKLSSFRPPQDPREREVVCYQIEKNGTIWQVLVVPKTKTVTYSRFRCPEQLPTFAPQPQEREELNPKTPESGKIPESG